MSVRVSAAVWSLSEQKGTPLIVMLALADMARDDGLSWPGVPHIAKKARISKRQAVRVLAQLRESRELELVRQGGGTKANMYRINLGLLYSRESLHLEDTDFEDMGDTPDMMTPLSSGAEGVTPGAVNVPPVSPETLEEPSGETSENSTGDGEAAPPPAEVPPGDAGAELTLPGMPPAPAPAAPSPKPRSAPQITPEIQEVWDYHVRTFGDRLRIKELTPPRVKTIAKALKAVGDDVAVLKTAIDGLKSYRSKHPDRSQDVSLDAIFSTGPQDRSNLTEKIEWWASQAEGGQTDVPATVPSAHRSRVLELAVLVLTPERRPGDASVVARAEEARVILADRFKLKVKSDGSGKLAGWETVS